MVSMSRKKITSGLFNSYDSYKEGKVRTKTIRFSGCWIWSLFAVLIMLFGAGPVRAAGEIAKTIDKSNVSQYEDILMPALYRAVERGDYILTTGKLNFEYKHWNTFLEAGQKNAGKFQINAEGDLVDKTGEIPLYHIYGFPFPNIDSKDPKVADKIMWNVYFNKGRIGGFHYQQRIQWVNNEKGIHRYILSDSRLMGIQGRPTWQAVPESENPEHWSYAEFGIIKEPYSMRNTNQLDWDYMDKRDMVQMSYVPVIRRIRQTSGVSRSDPWMGSDGWQDLTFLWGGKNRTMTWKLAGEQTILVPFAGPDKTMAKKDPDGTLFLHATTNKYGYDTPGWTGVKWAVTSAIWVPRKCWVIEQMPRDPYYAWGLHRNWVDKETNEIWMKEIDTKAGEFRSWTFNMGDYNEAPDGDNNAGVMNDQTQIDEKARHATVTVHPNAPGDKFAMYLPLSRMPMSFYTKSNLMALSK